VIYRHVDVLARHGFDAYVVHERQDFRCTWFNNETPVRGWSRRRYAGDDALLRRGTRYVRQGFRRSPGDRPFLQLLESPSFRLAADDVVVVPEHYGPHLAEIAPGIPKVIFNQGLSLTFQHYPLDMRTMPLPYRHRDVVATIV